MTTTALKPMHYDPQALAEQLQLVDQRVQVRLVHPWIPVPCTICQGIDAVAVARIVWCGAGAADGTVDALDGHVDACVACALAYLAKEVVPACGDADRYRAPIDVQLGRPHVSFCRSWPVLVMARSR